MSVTSLIYWYIFLTAVNTQETSEIVMVDETVPPNHWYFYGSVTKILAFKIFWQIYIIINIQKFLGHSQKLAAFRTCNENSVLCFIPLIILVDRCTVDRRKVYDL